MVNMVQYNTDTHFMCKYDHGSKEENETPLTTIEDGFGKWHLWCTTCSISYDVKTGEESCIHKDNYVVLRHGSMQDVTCFMGDGVAMCRDCGGEIESKDGLIFNLIPEHRKETNNWNWDDIQENID